MHHQRNQRVKSNTVILKVSKEKVYVENKN